MSRVEPNRNVYVGHRYVPKIFGEWDKQNDYEGLSIVTHQGNSYTSKKRVPVGIDILNEEFWVITGNYNAQVDYYREETERVSKDLLLKSDLTYVDTELGKKSDLTYVDTELGKKADLTELIEKYNEINESIDKYGRNIENFGVKKGSENARENTLIINDLLEEHENIVLPSGEFHFEGDIYVPYNATIKGSGFNTELVINNGGMLLPDSEKSSLSDFRIKRTGSVGPALKVYAEGYGWRRIYISNVHISGSTGTGMLFQEGWIGTVINPVVQNCNIGVEIERGIIYGASANNLNFYGGEFQANKIGLKAYGVKGLNFFGTCIEGNTLYGVHMKGSMRDVLFYGCYFEANGFDPGGKEIFLDTAYPDSSAYNIRFDGGGFLRGATGSYNVFDIRGGKHIVITNGVSFYGYQDAVEAIIKVSENYPGHSTGYVGVVNTNSPMLIKNETINFGKQRIITYALNKDFITGENIKSSFKVLPLEYPTKNIEFELTFYSDYEGTFSLSEDWSDKNGNKLRTNIDGFEVVKGFNTFKRSIALNGYSDVINVIISRNGTSPYDTLENNVTLTQADIYVIDNKQKL